MRAYNDKTAMLEKCGFTKTQARKMIDDNEDILEYIKPNSYITIEYMTEIGAEINSIPRMIVAHPQLLILKKADAIDRINHLKDIGIPDEKLLKILLIYTAVLSLTKENIDNKIKFFLDKGLEHNKIIKMIIGFPSLLGLSEQNISDRIKYFTDMGLGERDTIKIIADFPQVLGLSEDNLTEKINNLRENGIKEKDIFSMILGHPQLLSYSLYRVNRLLNLYYNHELIEYVIKKPKNLMTSYELVKSRTVFLINNGYEVNGRVFSDSKSFFKKHGITKEQLLKMYEEHIKTREGLEIGQVAERVASRNKHKPRTII